MPSTLPIPDFFDSERVGQLYRVPYETRATEAREWATRHGLKPAAGDAPRVGLLLVDCQNTFCLPGGELFVAGRSGLGAVKDSWRLCQFLYRHLGRVTEIVVFQFIHLRQIVEESAANSWIDARRVRQIQNRISDAAEFHALVSRRQKTASPKPVVEWLPATALALRDHDDERRKIFVERTQAVGEPGSDARPAGQLKPCLEERHGRIVVDGRGVHRFDEREVIGDLRDVRHKIADPGAGFAALLEIED